MTQDKTGQQERRPARRSPLRIALVVLGVLVGGCVVSGTGVWLYLRADRNHRADVAWTYAWQHARCEAQSEPSAGSDSPLAASPCIDEATRFTANEYDMEEGDVLPTQRRYFDVMRRVGNAQPAEEDCRRVVSDGEWCRERAAAEMLAGALNGETLQRHR